MLRRRSVLAFALTLCAASSASAQTAADPSEPIIRHGLQLREQGMEREALAEFTRAWEMGHTPRARAQMALAEQALGEWVAAFEHMTEALDARTDPWIASRRSVLEEAFAVIRGRVGQLEVESDPVGAEVSIDGVVRGSTPLAHPIALVAGSHVVEARMQGRLAVSRSVSVHADEVHREALVLAPMAAVVAPASSAPAASPAPVVDRADRENVGPGAGPWVVMAAGAAALALGTVFWILRGNELVAAAHACNTGSDDFLTCGDAPTRAEHDAGIPHYDTAVTDSWVAGSAFIVGGLAVAGGLVGYLVARSHGRSHVERSHAARVRFFVAPSADGAMVGFGSVM
jgi:hypothetical protein